MTSNQDSTPTRGSALARLIRWWYLSPAPWIVKVLWLCGYAVLAWVIWHTLRVRHSAGIELLIVISTVVLETVLPGICAFLINRMVEDIAKDKQLNSEPLTIPSEVLEISGHIILTLSASCLAAIWGAILLCDTQANPILRLGLILLVIFPFIVLLVALSNDVSKFAGYKQHKDRIYFRWVFPAMVASPMSVFRIVATLLLFIVAIVRFFVLPG